MDYYEKLRLAQDEKTSPEILEELSKDEDWEIRSCVASNCSTPEKSLIRLSKDRESCIRYYAINNKNCGGILKEMVRVDLEQEGKVEGWEFGYNRIRDRLHFLGFLTDWKERYFHGLL